MKAEVCFRVADVASILSVTTARVYQMINQGELQASVHYVEGKGWRPIMTVPVDSLLAYARQRYGMQPGSELHRAFMDMMKQMPAGVRELTQDQLHDILRRYDCGDSVYSLAKLAGVSNGSMRNLLQEHGRDLRTQRAAFDMRTKNWLDRLPQAVVNEAIARYAKGEGTPKIANALGWGTEGAKKVRRILEAEGIPLRDRSRAAEAYWSRRKCVTT